MSLNDEEARAAAYRAQAGRRIANLNARAAGLGGDRTARAALLSAWEPVRAWLSERRYSGAPGAAGGLQNWPDRPHGIGPHRGSHDADG